MSVVELMQVVKEHIIFYKQDILQGLGRIAPETIDQDLAVPQGHPVTQSTTTDVGGSAQSPGAHGATPSLFGPSPETPPVKPISLPTADDVRHTLPGFADPPLEGNATVLSTKPKMKDWLTGQDASPIEAVTQLAPPTASVVELTSPIPPSDQTEEERWYMLVVTALVRRLNLEVTRVVILGDTVTTSAGDGAFQNPQMAAVLHGPIRGRRAIGNQGATMEELVMGRCRVRITIMDTTNLPKGKRDNDHL